MRKLEFYRLLRSKFGVNLSCISWLPIWWTLTNFHGGIIHTSENIGFLHMVVLIKQPQYGKIYVALVEIWNETWNVYRFSIDMKKKFIILIVFIVLLSISITFSTYRTIRLDYNFGSLDRLSQLLTHSGP